jgi:stage II sporulation protein AA (anti-sigma F factor antagonist)
MKVESKLFNGALYLKLIGDMDENSSLAVRHMCDKLIDENINATKIIFNLEQVAFMDSTGIGFLIGRYKKALRLGIPIFVQKPNFAADKVLSLSGIYSLISKTE